jgi:hypothetical protein
MMRQSCNVWKTGISKRQRIRAQTCLISLHCSSWPDCHLSEKHQPSHSDPTSTSLQTERPTRPRSHLPTTSSSSVEERPVSSWRIVSPRPTLLSSCWRMEPDQTRSSRTNLRERINRSWVSRPCPNTVQVVGFVAKARRSRLRRICYRLGFHDIPSSRARRPSNHLQP